MLVEDHIVKVATTSESYTDPSGNVTFHKARGRVFRIDAEER